MGFAFHNKDRNFFLYSISGLYQTYYPNPNHIEPPFFILSFTFLQLFLSTGVSITIEFHYHAFFLFTSLQLFCDGIIEY